jgi:hypothetical protein
MNGHDVVLFLPIEVLNTVALDELPNVAQRIEGDLNKLCHGIENEWFNAVRLELNDENDVDFQRAILFSKKQPVNPDAVEFWKPGLLRLFISHRNGHKKDARDLSDALENYGVSCFVAHDTIQPMSEWRHEIIRGLETMEVMLLYVTDDFEKSYWCQQEVGYALCKGVPIISLKLGHSDPPGFISHVQALQGYAGSPNASAQGIFLLIGKALSQQTRLQDALISSLIESPDFTETKLRFDRLVSVVKTLTEPQLQRLIKGFSANDQLFKAGHLVSKYERFCKYLDSATGRSFVCEGQEIREQKNNDKRLVTFGN